MLLLLASVNRCGLHCCLCIVQRLMRLPQLAGKVLVCPVQLVVPAQRYQQPQQHGYDTDEHKTAGEL